MKEVVVENYLFNHKRFAIVGIEKYEDEVTYCFYRITPETYIRKDVLGRFWERPPLVIAFERLRRIKNGNRSGKAL